MATADERPASVYDNLNAILPPAQCSTPKTPTATMSTSTTSPYADISFKFDASRSPQQQQQHALNPTNAINQSSINAPSPVIHYTPHNNNTSTSPYSQVNKTAPHSSRPLSQHSDSNGYSGIAAVKAALNDAKSKFFGLNGSATNDTIDSNQESLLPNTGAAVQTDQKPKIVPKSQPKYQNIPENSAIFRNSTQASSPPPPPPLPASLPVNNNKSNTPETSRPSTTYSANSSPISSTGQNLKFKDSPNSVQYSTIQHKPSIDMDFGISSQPSQAVYMATTVPQNIKGSKIAGRHTPTRNSLRHSRMLVVNKSYQGSNYPNPMGFRFPRLTRTLLILEVITGILITFLGVWILLLAPHTDIQDDPYWSGLALLFAGIMGLVLIRYKRIKRHKLRENCFTFFKLDSYVLSILAALLCFIAFICTAIHLCRLSADDTKCTSSDILLEQAACECTFNTNSIPSSNETLSDLNPSPDSSYSFHYRDLSCSEVNGIWMSILTFSLILNCVGFIFSSIYLILLVFFRYRKVYSSVQTSVF